MHLHTQTQRRARARANERFYAYKQNPKESIQVIKRKKLKWEHCG